MKKLIALILTLCTITAIILPVEARTSVRSYHKSNGTYVQKHYRTDKDHTKSNNWSTKGNINPYTGKKGYK